MTRISRTAALSAAAVLALGIAACSPPNQKNSDAPVVTTVSPEEGYAGAGVPDASDADSTESTEATEAEAAVADIYGGTGTLTTEEPSAR
ncbi:hypothetical protein [Corynebacterium terpenotabidum]|uniref:Secreted protein n=1 Tax=Corynebacterium terpenotabidum Y-11 TaxID=1200352 RepID=S4XD44_9CORY|nr:hypothetical protein [Corynebacterium terpenotabidum]AGP30461.1 hypothetical protein A606_04060 [Corynebacterium terpenotabidum Y-11]